MIAHLSSEQLSECLLGQPSPLVAQHVAICPACRAELANFREALGQFRGAILAWSDNQANRALEIPATVPELNSWRGSQQLTWALVIAGVCILASLLFPWRTPENAPGNDAMLLNQVDAQVSRAVPASMEPLMKLVVQTNADSEKQE
jgi:anti-sigma factor RsiW